MKRPYIALAVAAAIILALVIFAHNSGERPVQPTQQQQRTADCVAYSAYCAIN